ncbi:VPS9 domain-containing protein 1 isoform X1 [Anguilla anguilla]|uniref:VPS9 domain-containing protein 1 isoform X1 n=1 Tax=Anguilla anguilla TaxID=7936 RepID=UPI0015B261EF|nr:VPS9 domain-containing protein 1 isoform X1 [Anguilla anguilla]XP_035252265.1 VPS9 domain-containing protein 1 isoform X1 [Anguilla anguilla]
MACAASDGGLKPLQNAMKLANIAIQLEAGNRHKEAYCEYLRSINYISHALLEDALSNPDREMVPVEVERMLRLAEQCLERLKSFVGKRGDLPTSAPAQAPTPTPTSAAPPISSAMKNEAHIVACPVDFGTVLISPEVSPMAFEPAPPRQAPRPTHRRVLSEGGGELSPFLPPEIFQKLQEAESQDSKKELTPIEEASRLNQKLKANYEARLARLHPGQATQKTSLTLSLQRQMMENLIIAKARQDALHRKMEERRLRLQEEANRRFAGSDMITPEEQEQRLLYANVLEYDQDHDWPKLWKANLKKNPNDSALVSGLISYLLSCSEHPVMKLLKRLQYRVYNRLYPIVSKGSAPSPTQPMKSSRSAQNLRSEQLPAPRGLAHSVSDASLSVSLSVSRDLNANEEDSARAQTTPPAPDRENSFEDLEQYLSQLDWSSAPDSAHSQPGVEVETYITRLEESALKDHLRAIVKDIHNAIDRLLSLCLLSFECLNTAAGKDQCVACLEEAFFCPIWRPLLALFRQVYRERELSFGASMRLYRNATPADVGVAPKLFPEDPALLPGSYPYESAVQELQHLCREFCPQRKLECIVRTLRLICVCAEDYRGMQDPDVPPSTAAIGADDLLPILSFVALRTELPQLVSECAALEEFIHEGYLIGEEGYCLTSMQSALSYVESLHTGKAPPHYPRFT